MTGIEIGGSNTNLMFPNIENNYYFIILSEGEIAVFFYCKGREKELCMLFKLNSDLKYIETVGDVSIWFSVVTSGTCYFQIPIVSPTLYVIIFLGLQNCGGKTRNEQFLLFFSSPSIFILGTTFYLGLYFIIMPYCFC
jgi:hypothetical protein